MEQNQTTVKDNNKYEFHTAYDASTEEAVALFAKNGKVVEFESLPTREQDIYRSMIAEIVGMIFPEETDESGESEDVKA